MQKKRLYQIISSLSFQFSLPLAGLLLSLTVVRLYSRDFWGIYVQHLLVVTLVLTAVNIGSRDYLLRQFSRAPYRIGQEAANSIVGKLTVMAALLPVVAMVPWSPLYKEVILLWIPAQLSWQFFEALVLYRRQFRQAVVIEVAVTGLLVAVLLLWKPGIYSFLLLSAGAHFLKGTGYFLANREYFNLKNLAHARGLDFIKATLPFLGLSLAGAASSRGELYVMGLLGEAGRLGQYQVLVNFIHSSHLLGYALLLPFIRNLYRLNAGAVNQLERRFLFAGLALAPMLCTITFLALRFGYHFHFSPGDYLLSGGIILAFFAYAVRIQACFRQNRTHLVTGIIAMMGVINVALSIWLIPRHGISGALWSALFAQAAGVVVFRQVKHTKR